MKLSRISALSLILIMLALAVFAEPEGPSVEIVNSTRRSVEPATTFETLGGNVTQLTIYGTSVTSNWQGFYGNVTGKITLDDAQNYTIYDWSANSPAGEIYASDQPIDFTTGNVKCYNFSHDTVTYLSLVEYHEELGIGADRSDAVNATFNDTLSHNIFYVGNYLIDSAGWDQGCPTVYLYNSSGEPDPRFQEVMLYDYTSNRPVYAALLVPGGALGFNNLVWDFQMIVAENGSAGNVQSTDYYFYMEIE